MKLLNIALRNLDRQKRRSLMLACAIAIGILIVTLVNGFSAGTVRVIKENMADLIGGQVFVTMQHKTGDKTVTVIADDSKLVAALHKLGIQDADMAKSIDIQGSLIFGGKDSQLTVVGVPWQADSSIRAKLGLSPAEFAQATGSNNGLILSRKTADALKAAVGDTVLLKCKTVSGQQNVGDFRVSYITADNSATGGMMAFANRSLVNQLANLPSPMAYLVLRVHLASIDLAPDFARRLEAELAPIMQIAPTTDPQYGMADNIMHIDTTLDFQGERVQVTTINQMLSMLTDLSDGLSIASVIMLVVLLAITMLGITNTFRMILHERIQEIGTMRALGMFRNQVRRLFLYEAVCLSLLGVAIGVGLAGVGMLAVGLVNFGTDSPVALFLHNGHLSFSLDPVSLLVSTILVVGFTWLAALGPAGKAAKLSPAEAMRTSY